MVTIPKELTNNSIERAVLGNEALRPKRETKSGDYLFVNPHCREISAIGELRAQTFVNAMFEPLEMISIDGIGMIFSEKGTIGAGLAFYFYTPCIVGKVTDDGLEPLNRADKKKAKEILKGMRCYGNVDGNKIHFYKYIDFYEEDEEDDYYDDEDEYWDDYDEDFDEDEDDVMQANCSKATRERVAEIAEANNLDGFNRVVAEKMIQRAKEEQGHA